MSVLLGVSAFPRRRLNVCCPVRGGIRWLQPPSLPRCLVKATARSLGYFRRWLMARRYGAVQSRTGAYAICPFGQNFPVYSFATAKLFRNPRAGQVSEHDRANAYKSGAIIGQRVNQVKRHYHQKRKPRQALQGQPGSVCLDIQNTSARSLASIRRAVNPSHCSFPKSNQQHSRP